MAKLDANLEEIEEKIEELRGLISDKEDEIKDTEKALEEAVITEEAQYAAMKQRMKFMYEQGQTFYLDLLFTSENFGDLLARTEYIEKIISYDREKLEEYREAKEQVRLIKEELEAEKIVLDAAKVAVEEEQSAVNELIVSKEKEIKNYEADINNKSQVVKEYEAEIAAQNATIAALEQAVAAEKSNWKRPADPSMTAENSSGLPLLIHESQMTMETASIPHWECSSFTMAWIWQLLTVHRFWRPTVVR